MKILIKYMTVCLLLQVTYREGCRTQSNSGSTTSSPVFTHTYPSSGQILIIENPTYVYADEKFTFYIFILTHQNSTFSLIIDFGDQNYQEINTTQKTIPMDKIYSDFGLYRLNVSVVFPFYINETKTIVVIKNTYSRRFYGLDEIDCFNDNETERDLDHFIETYELKMTNDLCGDICFQEKFSFAGTQNGSDCFCGNSYGKYDQGNCTMNCSGDSEQICGDVLKNSVYKINYEEVSINCNPKKLFLNEKIMCEVNLILKNYSYSGKIAYGDTNMTSVINSTNTNFSFERTITKPGVFVFRVDVDDLNIHALENVNATGLLLQDCPTVVKKGEQFNFSIEFYGFDQNVTISFGDLTSITIENPNGLKFSSKMFINKTYNKFGHYKIFAYDAFKMFNSTCYIKLDGSTLDLNDLNSVVYLLDKKLDLNDCLNNCSGNGICRQLTDNFFKCSCFEDFEGNSCQTNKLKCFRKPCLNNGICNETKVISSLTDYVNYEYECICSDRFYGTHCENMKKDYCTNKTCSGNGICFFNKTSEQGDCKCFPLYSGNYCQIESSEMKTIKKVISTATIIAITTIFLLFSTLIILDILSVFTKKKSNKVAPMQKIEIFKPIYVN